MAADLCPGCGALPATVHDLGCPQARCMWTGRSRRECRGWVAGAARYLHHLASILDGYPGVLADTGPAPMPTHMQVASAAVIASAAQHYATRLVATFVPDEDPMHQCGHDLWTGENAELADARRLGLWCRMGTPAERLPDGGWWVPCEATHPDARPDLNALATMRWDRVLLRWERP